MDNLRRHISYWKKRPIQEPQTGGVTMVQQLRKSITTLAFFAISAGAAAQAPTAPLTLRPDAPDRYVVVPGDTLWAISQRYTDSPWRWPELWGLNKDQIRNPHLIYRVYVILIDRSRGQLTIGAKGTAPAAAEQGAIKLGPRIRSEAVANEQIRSIPASVIEPFLSRPLIVEPDGLDKAPTIVGTQTDRVILAAGNAAHLRGIWALNGKSRCVFPRGASPADPGSPQTLAHRAIYHRP